MRRQLAGAVMAPERDLSADVSAARADMFRRVIVETRCQRLSLDEVMRAVLRELATVVEMAREGGFAATLSE